MTGSARSLIRALTLSVAVAADIARPNAVLVVLRGDEVLDVFFHKDGFL
jgi:hypothetical protein